MAQNFLTSSRHGTVFYFRRRVPDDLREIVGKLYLVKTLNTIHRGAAIVLARAYAVKTDAFYHHLRAMKKKTPEFFQTDYTLKFEFDNFGQVKSMHSPRSQMQLCWQSMQHFTKAPPNLLEKKSPTAQVSNFRKRLA